LINPAAGNLTVYETRRVAASGEEFKGVTEDRFNVAVERATVGHGGFSAAVVADGTGTKADEASSGMPRLKVDNAEEALTSKKEPEPRAEIGKAERRPKESVGNEKTGGKSVCGLKRGAETEAEARSGSGLEFRVGEDGATAIIVGDSARGQAVAFAAEPTAAVAGTHWQEDRTCLNR
jgi:hypothetical protein